MRQGLTLETLALRAGLASNELASIERDNTETLPVPRLLKIADALNLRKAADFATLMQINGVSRRFRAYCLGLAKTGTTSLAGIFSGYRSAHEFQQWDTHQAVIAYKQGRLSLSEFRAFIRSRDAAGALEMDAAHFNRHYIEILAEEFPQARFIYLIRDPFSWLNSLINFFTFPQLEAGHSQELPNGMPFDLPMGEGQAKKELIRNFNRYIDWQLAFWTAENRAILAKLPPGRSLIIRTHEIKQNLAEMARLVSVAPERLLPNCIHLNKSPYRVKVLERYNRRFLKEKFAQHCDELLETYFPGYTLDDCLDGHPIAPHPGLTSRSIK